MMPIGDSCFSYTATTESRDFIPKCAPSYPVPLTFQQEFMLETLMKHSISVPIFDARRLRGELNIDILCRSLSLVVARHESLRTRIIDVDTSPKQKIDEAREFELKVLRISGISNEEIEAEARRFLHGFIWRRVELEVGPLFDVRLLQLGKRDYVLALVLHHLITDVVSCNLLLREIWDSYSAFSRGHEPNLPTVSMQYSDYALWQRKGHSRWLEEHEGYWSRRLAGAVSAKLQNDTAFEGIGHQRVSTADMSFEQVSPRLNELARNLRTTTAFLLLALYAIVLFRWSGQRDFVLPYVVSGRIGSMDLNVMGYLGQFLMLRIELTGDETFIDVLKCVSREFFSAYKHLDFSRKSNTHQEFFKGASLNGLVSSVDAFALTKFGNEDDVVSVESFPVEMILPAEYGQPNDVYCILLSTAAGIHAHCLYKASLFKPETIHGFLNDFRLFTEQVTSKPTLRIASLRSLRDTNG
jgi:Condensation domain